MTVRRGQSPQNTKETSTPGLPLLPKRVMMKVELSTPGVTMTVREPENARPVPEEVGLSLNPGLAGA